MKTWNDNAASQRYKPPINTLVTILDGAAVPSNNSVTFVVPIVDSRLRVKISVLFAMAAGSTLEVNLTGFANLWLAECEEDESGVTGRLLPAVNIEGTEAAPTAVPSASPLYGYSREFVSAADYIQGKFTILSNVTLGTWYLKTRYQPDVGQRFSPAEWEEIRSLSNPRLMTPAFSF